MHFPSSNYGYGYQGYNGYGGMIQDPERRAANQVAYQMALARHQAAALNRAQGGPGTSGNPLPMSQPHDWTSFDQMFPAKPGTNGAPVAGGAAAVPAPSANAGVTARPMSPGPMGSSANPIPLSPAHDWTYFNKMFPNGVQSSVPMAPRVIPGGNAPIQSGEILPAALDPQDYLEMQQRHTDLYRNYPNVFAGGSPANLAFVNHAVQYGPASAYRNADTILAPFRQQQEAAGPANARSPFNADAYLT